MKRKDLYADVTKRVIDALESGESYQWIKMWNSRAPQSYVTRKPYQGINIMLLGMTPFESPYWLTFKQCAALGGKIKAGSKGTSIVYWTFLTRENEETGEEKTFPFMREYYMFNYKQTEGLPAIEESKLEFTPIESAESLWNNWQDKPIIRKRNSDIAAYIPSGDYIYMPARDQFKSVEAYYSVLFHEASHATGHESRLNRNILNRFGSPDYAIEELVAELSALMLCQHVGIEREFTNSVAYLQNWLTALKNDNRLIIRCASMAQKAFKYIVGESAEQTDESE